MPPQESGGGAGQPNADKIPPELRRRRTQQLETAKAAAERLETALHSARDKSERSEALANHLSGFYDEVDKLAKGKALVEATDLIVEHANAIVQDAKALIQGDSYLDRVKEFVPAGDNPVYPDVLLTARTVQQAVGRFQSLLVRKEQNLALRLRDAKTIVSALRFFLDLSGHIATTADVAKLIDQLSPAWFTGNGNFDFVRLDNRDIAEYLSVANGL
jgi:hypothetical protein